MDTNTIEQLIREHLPGSRVEVSSPDNTHYQATVVWAGFDGQNRLSRQRAVHKALGESLGGEIHAMSLTCWSTDEASEYRIITNKGTSDKDYPKHG